MKALAQHLGCYAKEVNVSSYDDNVFEYGREEYLVITDDEAERLWDEDLDNYIDDCLEIPEAIRPYFDEEKWKNDARTDGRGHSLNRYDGNEIEIKVSNTQYFIYRQN